MKPTKALSKRAPEWHAEAAAELNRETLEVEALNLTAARRRVRLGLMFLYVKVRGKEDGSIPHGQFGPWLKEHCAQIPWRTVGNYIAEAKSVSERMGWQICQFGNFETAPHRLLELPSDELPTKERKAQQLLLDLVDGKGKFVPVTEYKQVEEGADVGDAQVKRGRAKGCKGTTREQRIAAQELDAAERFEALRITSVEVAEWLMQAADLQGIGALMDPEFSGLCHALETAWGFASQVRDARGGGR